MYILQQVTPAADKLVIGKLPAVRVNLAKPLQHQSNHNTQDEPVSACETHYTHDEGERRWNGMLTCICWLQSMWQHTQLSSTFGSAAPLTRCVCYNPGDGRRANAG